VERGSQPTAVAHGVDRERVHLSLL